MEISIHSSEPRYKQICEFISCSVESNVLKIFKDQIGGTKFLVFKIGCLSLFRAEHKITPLDFLIFSELIPEMKAHYKIPKLKPAIQETGVFNKYFKRMFYY